MNTIVKTYIKKVADHRVRKDTLRNFGALVLIEIIAIIALVNLGLISPQVLHLMSGMLINLIPAYFFSKYKDRSQETLVVTASKEKT